MKYGMRFQSIKCSMMQLQVTRKQIINFKFITSYSMEGTGLENVHGIKYLSVTIINDLSWNTHIRNTNTKENKTPGMALRGHDI